MYCQAREQLIRCNGQKTLLKYNLSHSVGWWWRWLRTPLIPALGRQRQVDFWVQGQPGLQSEFQDSQGYSEKPCLGGGGKESLTGLSGWGFHGPMRKKKLVWGRWGYGEVREEKCIKGSEEDKEMSVSWSLDHGLVLLGGGALEPVSTSGQKFTSIRRIPASWPSLVTIQL